MHKSCNMWETYQNLKKSNEESRMAKPDHEIRKCTYTTMYIDKVANPDREIRNVHVVPALTKPAAMPRLSSVVTSSTETNRTV